jgi:hypothetical protein
MATLHGLFYYYVCLRIISYCIVPASSGNGRETLHFRVPICWSLTSQP